jgi:hypothetical protein
VITILLVGEREHAEFLDAIAARQPSLELLHAVDVEEALDRLARNRRIDAVLLIVEPAMAREIAGLLLEEDPAGPPIFLPLPASAPGTRSLPASSPEELLDSIEHELRADS